MDPARVGSDVTVLEGPEELPATVDGSSSGASDAPPVLPGQMVGRYEVLDVLGKGGMGSVFTAHDPDLDRTVAIKLLHSGIDDQRLEREARALARVSHPNVIAVYDVGRSQGRLFVAMEYVEGVTLRRWLVSERRSFEAILGVFAQAGRGLAAAHAAGLVHRDFKPDNVLLGHDGRVRVLDFGLVGGVSAGVEPARSALPAAQSPTFEDDSSGGPRLTENGSLIGTPAYMALEQYSAAAPDPRTDQFSYCVALWEALYGRRPYDSKSVVELLERLRSGTPPEAPRGSDVPLWLERIVRRGLSRQLEARYPSMGDLLAQLETSQERARAREQLIGYRYRPLGASSEGGAAIDTFTDQQVVLVPTSRPLDFELLGSFEHPNLVPVTDVALGAQGAKHYLVLDLAQPRKTFEEASQGAPLSIQLEWLSELLRAFLYLHRRGVGYAAACANDVLVVAGRVRLLVTAIEPFQGKPSVSRDLDFVGALARRLAEQSPALGGFVRALSAAAGGDQYADAAQALEALGRAAERPFAVENAETRESSLRALPLLGRSAALENLHEALANALAGRGSALFIEGESGVGKSRLLEEFRRAAVARGVIALEGRGEASDRSPYRVFRLPLLRLSLRAGSEALDEFQLEALTPLIPELPSRLGRAEGGGRIDLESKQDALSAVVVSLLRQQREPVLLVLEDLQWSGSESFALLAQLVELCEQQPLLLVGGCRSEERAACPPLPPGFSSLCLSRLTTDDIAEVCARLLDVDGPAPSELVALLVRETEGNAFFLVEALRALAEEAGSLGALKSATLPARIFTGGIQTLIRRHLAAISERSRRPLRAAAVIGRTIDPTLLRALEPELDVDAWVSECVAAAVLERFDAGRELGVRFRHDKLREALLEELEPEERRSLHAQIAHALERTRAGDRLQLAPLARHFQAAGDEEKELSFAAQAGEQALHSRAYTEAAEFLQRAITLSERGSRGELLPQLYALRAELHAQRADWAAAQREIARVFSAAGRPLWERHFGPVLFLFVQLVVHVLRSFLPAPPASDPRHAARRRALVRAADVQLNIALSRGDNLLALASSFLALNVGDRAHDTSVRALFLVGLAAKVARLRGVTRRYIARANELLPLTSDRKDLSEALSYSGLYWVGEGKLGRAREQLLRSVEASTSIGYQQPLAWSLGQLSMCASLRGKFAEMLEQAELCEQETTAGEPTQVAAKCTQTLALLRLGRLEEAKQRFAALPARSASESPLSLAIRAATAARVELEHGHIPAALAAAEHVHELLPGVSQVPPIWPDVLTIPIEVYLSAWQQALETGASVTRVASQAKRRARALAGWSRLYPVARPIADYFSGRVAWLSGNEERATVLLERAHEAARARGLGHYELAAGAALAALRAPRQTKAM